MTSKISFGKIQVLDSGTFITYEDTPATIELRRHKAKIEIDITREYRDVNIIPQPLGWHKFMHKVDQSASSSEIDAKRLSPLGIRFTLKFDDYTDNIGFSEPYKIGDLELKNTELGDLMFNLSVETLNKHDAVYLIRYTFYFRPENA